MKVITLGNGFVAQHLPYEIVNVRIEENTEQIKDLIRFHKPSVIVNCIGHTGKGHNIDSCENDKINVYSSNVTVPLLLAKVCSDAKIKLIHLSSGCIFYGTSPNKDSEGLDIGWREDDFAHPLSYYSKTKYATDLLISQIERVCSLRIRMPISKLNHKRNLLNKLLGYSQVLEHKNSVTFLDDFVKCVDWVINNDISGVLHVANPQPLTHIEILNEYRKYFPEHKFEAIDAKQLEKLTLAPRSNCILDTTLISRLGFNMTNSYEALDKCMKVYALGRMV